MVGDVQYQKNNAEIMTDVKKVLHNYETNNYLFTLYNLIKAQYKVNFFSKETSDEWEQRKHKSIKKNINKLQKNLLLNIISLGKYGNFKSVMYKLQDNIKEKETKSKCSYCGNVSSTKNMDFASKNKEGIHWKCKNGCNNSQTTYDKENIDYYKDILGIQGDITEEKIKQAYREKVKKKHPDQGGSMKEFMKIKDAYNSLLEKIV